VKWSKNMSKNPLLPGDYRDSVIQANILYALKKYENPGTSGIINPQIKWKLHQAWEEAEELLARSRWHYRESPILDAAETEYELTADSDDEVDRVNTIIAGLVAYQIMNPERKVALRRIEHKKGGEMSLVVSSKIAKILKELFPTMRLGGENDNGR